ncbi:MAG: hypothetical protein ACPLPT_05270 [Moorellales bacterium]
MLAKVLLVFWFWTAPLLSLAAGWPGWVGVVAADLGLGWWLGTSLQDWVIMAGVGTATVVGGWVLGRRYSPRDLIAAAGLGLVLGLVTRPIVGLLGGGLLPYMELSRRSQKYLWLALAAPLVRVLTALGFGLWLMLLAW